MAGDHTVTAYDRELEDLRSTIARMGGLAEAQLAAAIDALYKRDTEAAGAVVKADKEIDELESETEKKAIASLVRRQPMADDLREIIAALKMSSEVERVGDYAKNIAKRVVAITETDRVKISRSIADMGQIVQKMLKDVLDAYIDHDAQKAIGVWERDEAVDELYNSLFRELLTYMMEDPRLITACTHLLFTAKNVERMGDHVTNIAELVYYMVTGEVLADERPKGDQTSFTVVTPED